MPRGVKTGKSPEERDLYKKLLKSKFESLESTEDADSVAQATDESSVERESESPVGQPRPKSFGLKFKDAFKGWGLATVLIGALIGLVITAASYIISHEIRIGDIREHDKLSDEKTENNTNKINELERAAATFKEQVLGELKLLEYKIEHGSNTNQSSSTR